MRSNSVANFLSIGGTLDITVHEVNAENGYILEKHCPSGGLFGGIHVDREFEELMNNAFGPPFMRQFKDFPNDWQVIMNRFETHKRAEENVDNEEISIPLPLNFMRSCTQETGDDDDINNRIRRFYQEKVSVSSDYLNITMEALGDLHRPIVTKIAEHIKDLLSKESLQDVKTMFLVGGFSEAQFLRKEISKRFDDKMRILIPQDPELAIIHGAVEFAQDPGLLRGRVMGKTYGVDSWTTFDANIHPPQKREFRPNKIYCRDIFETLVKKNERIDIEEKRSYTFCPINPDQTEVSFDFYSTSQEDAQFITDPGVESESVEILIAGPDTTKGRNRRLRLDVLFGGTELKVKVTDVESGNVRTASIRLASKAVLHSRFR